MQIPLTVAYCFSCFCAQLARQSQFRSQILTIDNEIVVANSNAAIKVRAYVCAFRPLCSCVCIAHTYPFTVKWLWVVMRKGMWGFDAKKWGEKCKI